MGYNIQSASGFDNCFVWCIYHIAVYSNNTSDEIEYLI